MNIPLGAERNSESESTDSQMMQAIEAMKPEAAALTDKLRALDPEQLATLDNALNSAGHPPRALTWIETSEQAQRADKLIDNVLAASDPTTKQAAQQELYKYLRDI